jgi:hypothetical protein
MKNVISRFARGAQRGELNSYFMQLQCGLKSNNKSISMLLGWKLMGSERSVLERMSPI